ncbi:HlyD family efflux transporter periplasmic adaptor subunit [Chroococcidiopsis sp. TS-821]|uniref:HlyD family efflux transporter periplasmic adaptor subunit n=1 Tax=Chroococcidiopsis sp. TS-821 TaxID=1378066 RepID=UPI000CEE360B|nr:HlyD family efflux transporter periplasmic adaptor subunit [Chroococcidiopsis sp. TS-821]PPS43417.1 HlyD family secretion protein [Chroococcidiopsis sp. TS-821]
MSIVTEKPRSKQSRFKPNKWRIPFVLATTIVVGTVAFIRFHQTTQPPPTTVTSPKPVIRNVVALGRLEPQGEVVALSPPSSAQGARVEQILVKEGDWVKAGETVAILDTHTRLQAALESAQADVQVARAALAKIQAGAQTGEIEAQKAAIARLEAELAGQQETLQATVARQVAAQRNAQSDYERYQRLYQEGAISVQELETKRLNAETAQQQVNESQATRNETIATLQRQIEEARANLNRITEVRPTDVREAQAQVDRMLAAVKLTQADLALSYIKAPIDGEIIKIHTRSGETISSNGIAELARTNQMVVVAEVLEEDISKVRAGQTASITSENRAFAQKIQGTVTQVGRKIGKQNILDSDPAADVDARVVEVRISLPPDASELVSGLTYARVIVEISV